jgi:hypothetical protein
MILNVVGLLLLSMRRRYRGSTRYNERLHGLISIWSKYKNAKEQTSAGPLQGRDCIAFQNDKL